MLMMSIETHPLAPFCPVNATVLMLGSFPPPQQRWKMQFYYPNFHNDMWRIFGLVFFNDKEHFIDVANKSFYEQKLRQFLTQAGIAISDSAYQIKRGQNNASDKHLHIVTPADLTALLTKLPNCHTIMTTGELAATTTLSLLAPNAKVPKLGGHTTFDFLDKSMALYRLPSSSRAYPLALDKKASQYQTFFKNIGLL